MLKLTRMQVLHFYDDGAIRTLRGFGGLTYDSLRQERFTCRPDCFLPTVAGTGTCGAGNSPLGQCVLRLRLYLAVPGVAVQPGFRIIE